MPRKTQGGARTGTAGTSYTNRTDLQTQAVRNAPSSEYGQGVKLEAAQKALPLPDSAAMQAQGAAPQQAPGAPVGPAAGSLGSFDRGTERPGEHVSTGLPVGPGGGPEMLGPYSGDDTGAQLRSLYAQYPNQDLADLIEVFDGNRNG